MVIRVPKHNGQALQAALNTAVPGNVIVVEGKE